MPERNSYIPELVRKKIIAGTLEVAVLVTMGTHIYSYSGRLYLQTSRGSIVLRFMASLANLIMKKFDTACRELCKREGFEMRLYICYVDDCRIFSRILEKGWRWTDGECQFCWKDYEDDKNNSAITRTTRESYDFTSDILEFHWRRQNDVPIL